MGSKHSKQYKRSRSGSGLQTIEQLHDFVEKRKCFEFYVFPFDNDEIDRLTLQHYIFQNIWGSNFSSPVDDLLRNGAKVLDVGCGPGVWTLEMAGTYKRSSFTGIDIAANFPQSIKPENTKFLTGSFKELPFEDNTFDFVYMRLMMFALTIEDWPQAIKELVRVCKPNGWIELMERDILWHNETDVIRDWRTKIVNNMRETKGIELVITPHIPGFLHSNGQLTNINRERTEAKIAWGGKIYEAYGKVILWGAKNLSHAVSDVQFDEGTYDSLIQVAISELAKNKAYDESYRFWAQKKI